jgi:hypothetical protein
LKNFISFSKHIVIFWEVSNLGDQGDGDKKDEIKNVKKRISFTFYSILAMNWVLVIMGIIAFGVAVYSAAGGEFLSAAVFSAIGAGDVISVFTFAMDRAQRNLGDQTQVEAAFDGLSAQSELMKNFQHSNDINNIKAINREIRSTTLYTMKLIQEFTEIGKSPKKKAWLRDLPIKFGKLEITSPEKKNKYDEPVVPLGKEITITSSLENISQEPVTINMIVIAIRPPSGTPDGGPFRFDFYIDGKARTIKPKETHKIEHKKRLEESVKHPGIDEDIPKEKLGRDWYAFVAVQTEDECWHDDYNKVWFEVK